MRRAVMLAAAVAAMAPASAQAGTLTVRTIAGQWTELTYVAGPLEANAVQMSYDAKLGRLIFVDAGAPVTHASLQPGLCTRVPTTGAVACKIEFFNLSVSLTLLGLNDSAQVFQGGPAGWWVHVDAGQGNDRLLSTAGHTYFTGGPGADDMTPGDAVEYRYDDHAAPVDVSLDGLLNDGAFGELDNARPGTGTGTTMQGTDFGDVVHGSAGHEELLLGAGDDVADGGGGSDTIYGGDGADQIDGGPSVDFLIGEGGPDALFGDAGDDFVYSADDTATTDTVSCGDGRDFASHDAYDIVDADCEDRAGA